MEFVHFMSPVRLCGEFPQFCFRISVGIVDKYVVNLNVFINIGTNLLMKMAIHSCDVTDLFCIDCSPNSPSSVHCQLWYFQVKDVDEGQLKLV